jgi:hypothetical protein
MTDIDLDPVYDQWEAHGRQRTFKLFHETNMAAECRARARVRPAFDAARPCLCGPQVKASGHTHDEYGECELLTCGCVGYTPGEVLT